MKVNSIGLTKTEVHGLLYEEDVYDDNDNLLFKIVDKEVTDTDQEKGSVTYAVVIEKIATGKFYKANLTTSEWYLQDESNFKERWKIVHPKEITKTIYV